MVREISIVSLGVTFGTPPREPNYQGWQTFPGSFQILVRYQMNEIIGQLNKLVYKGFINSLNILPTRLYVHK